MKKSTYVICVILAILAVAGLSDGNFLMFLVFGLACAGFYVLRKRKADRSMTAVKQDVRELDPETPLPVVLNSGVVLTSGEICHYYGEATQ